MSQAHLQLLILVGSLDRIIKHNTGRCVASSVCVTLQYLMFIRTAINVPVFLELGMLEVQSALSKAETSLAG